jgi:hypothetical protein
MDTNFLNNYAPGNSSGIEATQQPDGRILITNVLGKENTFGQDPGLNFYNKMDLIQKEKDLDAKQKLMAELESDFSVYNTERLQRAQSLAEEKLGLANLRQQLVENEQLDKSDPKYLKYRSDSPITAQIRERLRVAEMQSYQMAEGIVKTDIDRMRHGSAVGSFIKIQERLIGEMLRKQGISVEEAERFGSSLNDTNRAALKALYPDTPDEQLNVKAAQIAKTPALKHEAQVILDPGAKPEDMLTAAIAGVGMAEPYVIRQQALTTGQSPSVVQQELKTIKGLVEDPAKLKDVAGRYLSKDEKEALNLMLGQEMLTKSKEDLQRIRLQKIETAVRVFRRVKAKEFENDVSRWTEAVDGQRLSQIPELAETFASYAHKQRPMEISTLFSEYVGNAPKEQRYNRSALLQKFIFANANKANSTLYGEVVDLPTLQKKTQALILFYTNPTDNITPWNRNWQGVPSNVL